MHESNQEAIALTHAQRQIWIGQSLRPDCPLYNMAFAWVLPATLDIDRFVAAWRQVGSASDALRTGLVDHGGDVRVRIAESAPDIAIVEDEPTVTDAASFARWGEARAARPLVPSAKGNGGSLVDCVLADCVLVRFHGGGAWGWYLNLHHLITDAASTALIFEAVSTAYLQEIGDDRAAEGDRVPYYETAHALSTDQDADARSDVDDAHRPLSLYGRPGRPDGTASTRHTLQLDASQMAALESRLAEPGFVSLSPELSRFAIFATLLLAWLHRTSGRADLRFDAPVAGRPTRDAKQAIGLFIEVFPFAVDLDGDETFRSLAAKCMRASQRFFLEARPGTSARTGSSSANVVLNYVPSRFGNFAGMPAPVTWLHPGHIDAVHALRLQVHDFADEGRWTLHLDANDGVLPVALAQRGVAHLRTLLDALLADPDQAIAAIDIRTGDEIRAHAARNATWATPPPAGTLIDRFLIQSETEPDTVALVEGEEARSFGALRREIDALAIDLLDRGVTRGDRIAIRGRRGIDTVVGILGTLRAGAAYVPIDLASPDARVAGMVSDAGARLLLAGRDAPPTDLDTAVPVVSIDQAIATGRARLDGDPGALEIQLDRSRPEADDLAYLLFTSGSTGRPKGVSISHGGVLDYLVWADRRYVRRDRLAFPLFTALGFDLTVTSLFLPLLTGGRLHIYPEHEGAADTALADVVRENVVDIIKLTPSHLALLRRLAPDDSKLRRMIVGGENLGARLTATIDTQFQGRLEIHNEYGPTEAVVGCIAHQFDRDRDGDRDQVSAGSSSVPIGLPADHVTFDILNHIGSPVPEGVAGELWLSRSGVRFDQGVDHLARGYQGLPALTAARFQPRPDAVDGDSIGGGRRYRTGDLARVSVAGTGGEGLLECLGRVDRQAKISGFRVEPAEIESALLSMPAVEQAAVVVRERKVQGASASAELRYCRRCGLPSNHPRAVFDAEDVCSVCRDYDAIKDQAAAYFKTPEELQARFAASRRQASGSGSGGAYDCMMMLSGGKDSTYALVRLVEMGLSVYAFTLDNGFISEGALDNARHVTNQLGVELEIATTPAMNAIFRDSLARFSNVCHGCFKAIYTLATQRADALDIPIIVTGLSRGQMFETRLSEEMFQTSSAEAVDTAVLAARKVYHRVDDAVSRNLDVSVFADDAIFERVQFVDFYRYVDIDLDTMIETLETRVAWQRPADTGRSTNCLINDIGIYVHKKERGFHNYALPYSWDVRLGHKTRDQALEELDDAIDDEHVRRTLDAIGLYPAAMMAPAARAELVAFVVTSDDVPDADLRAHLATRLPAPLVPTRIERIAELPRNERGKVDLSALSDSAPVRTERPPYRVPDGPVAEWLAEAWQEHLGVARVGADDRFFALGGTSLAAMEITIQLSRAFDIELPLDTLFNHPTLESFSRRAEDQILADVESLSDDDLEAFQDQDSKDRASTSRL